ncbi:helix-turn-helix transcriptional regulator [Paenibacillus methanolicus]|uniref:helix-turn-helix transcriptional regulator n=1 Tax=Paenibacillus methanolicus TaxID=582686 RepID=UPI0011E7D4A6|nr:helix-turn-helix transcriptional regulator [Paenibacillus methanolicus]
MKITVKAARVNCGMKAKEVARFLGLSVTGYSKKENGHARFYADEIARLSQLFKMPFENFFEAGCRKKTRRDCSAFSTEIFNEEGEQ